MVEGVSSAGRGLRVVLVAALLVVLLVPDLGPGVEAQMAGPWVETRFNTGCNPGPYQQAPPPDPPIPVPQRPYDPPETVGVTVNLDSAGSHPAILGTGFNFEHALWSCQPFRPVFRREILDPFQPAIGRVDTGLLPAAPPDLPASELGPTVYQSVLSSAPYADSWRFFQRLNRAGVKVVLGIWGGPGQFTDTGDRLGTLLPQHYDDYVDYVVAVVDFIVRQQGIQVWATTIANEPDGGDGNRIPPEGLAYIAHQLAPRLAPYGVKLYGPDTATAQSTLQYLPYLLADPTIVDAMAFVGFHQYSADPLVGAVADMARAARVDLPVIVTEYTSFNYGDLDAGQDTNDRMGFTLDVLDTVLAHYRYGVDAALYWDAIDYLQPGHDAITKWGLLRSPLRDFSRRTRYYGFLQVLPYLQPGARVLDLQQDGGNDVSTLAVRTANGGLAIFLLNEGAGDTEISLSLSGADGMPSSLVARRTDRARNAEYIGNVQLQDGNGSIYLPGESVTTLATMGAGPTSPEDR